MRPLRIRRQRSARLLTWVFLAYAALLCGLMFFGSSSEASEGDKTEIRGWVEGEPYKATVEPSGSSGSYTVKGWHKGNPIRYKIERKGDTVTVKDYSVPSTGTSSGVALPPLPPLGSTSDG